MADLIERLLNEAHEFNFFQAVSLLEDKFLSESVTDVFKSGKIRFIPDRSISFPPNDIADIRKEKDTIIFKLSFMGLVGAVSPLPLYFSEFLSRFPEKAEPLYDFLSIFNHRIYCFFYQAWKKYHFIQWFTESSSDSFIQKIAFLAGFDIKNPCFSNKSLNLLAYCSLFAGSSRSASGLASIISDYFGGIPVRLFEFLPRWSEIRNVKPVCEIQLGKNSILGTRFYDICGKFRVVVGPLKRNMYETFFPESDNIKNLQEIVKLYLSEPLRYEIEVQLQSMDLTPVVLGTDNARIGRTSALGKSVGKTDVQSIII